ncbi:acyl carrier protein [Fundidesulfovibrio agrisoli]|uniref:acyl carrier protein n=1 Tax=Fundidesulfovibrio agrisoli TaxID=2922717 RepID=UPI001FABFD16|nr:acyl carrier protein [Fundidesulfovibrio agrisoli]
MDVTTEILRGLLAEAGVDPVVAEAVLPGEPLLRQGVDSLDYPAFSLAVEARFGLSIDERASMSLRTLDDFAAYIRSRGAARMSKEEAIALLKQAPKEIEPDQKYEVDRLRPGDGKGVAQLFHAVYGDSYPMVDYYIPEAIERLNAEGKVLTVVARLASGAVAGQGAYYQSSPPNKALFEFGQLLVAPEYRNTTVAARITREMDRLSRTMPQAQGFFGEAVCTHFVTQKLIKKHSYAECGLEISLMPAGAYAKEGAGAQRVSCLLGARVDRDRHADLYLPECYRNELELILGGFSLDRELRFNRSDAPGVSASELESETFDFAGVERVQALVVGADFPERILQLDQEARRRGLAVVQVYVNAGTPGTAFAVEALRARGFVLGGLIPLWFGSDGLLMQKFYQEPEWETVNLFTDKAKALLGSIRAEWERARALA